MIANTVFSFIDKEQTEDTEMEEKNKGEPSFIDKDARLVFPLGKFGLKATSL